MDGDNIAALHQLLKADKLHMGILGLGRIGDIGVAGDDLRAEAAVENIMQAPSRQAESVEAQGQLPDIRR